MRTFGAAGNIIFSTSGDNERMRINPSGNVGIANNNPGNILQVGSGGRLRIANNESDYTTIGTNDIESVNTPVTTFLEGKNWKSVSCGGYHTAAIKTDGSLWGWGRNNYGQLGTNDAKNVIIPAIISLEENKWKSVSCGYYHTSAISVNK